MSSKKNAEKLLKKYNSVVEGAMQKVTIASNSGQISAEEAESCLNAFREILAFVRTLDSQDKVKFDAAVKKLIAERSALPSYEDKSLVIYTYEGIQGLKHLIN